MAPPHSLDEPQGPRNRARSVEAVVWCGPGATEAAREQGLKVAGARNILAAILKTDN